ncbi:MAG TPA: ATP-binding protein [Pirellulales bacterium]
MSSFSDAIDPLREALGYSPDNVPLRKHLATMLLNAGRADEAADVLRDGLTRHPDNRELKVGLAAAFFKQAKYSQSLVVIEDLLAHGDPPAEAHLWHCRLLMRRGEVHSAVAAYKAALDVDPDAADAELAEQLGIGADSTSEVVEGRQRAAWDEPPADPESKVERVKTTFAEVGGMEGLKEDIRLKIIYPLQHADLYAAYGKTAGGGILMYGPPGCGKTHLARATAGEIKAGFLSVGINDVLDMWIGNSERNLHELFEQARQNKPCVLFFDEVDALGARRSDMRASAGRHLINQFLSEMDGISSANDGLLVLAATNAPWHLDPAFRRPGRFDRVLFVPPPDAPARAAILEILCRGKPMDSIGFDQVAAKTDSFSGADLKAIVDVAVEAKLTEAMKRGVPTPLNTKDLLAAAKQVKPTTKEWFSSARNHALYANQGGVYDDILKHLKM